MSWVAVAIAGGAVIGAVGSTVAAGKQASGQKAAAQTQADMFNTITGQEQPFLNAGYGATTSLNNLLGTGSAKAGGVDPSTGLPVGYLTEQFSPKDLENYPGYQFALQQGDQAIQNSAAASTGAVSGPALKNLMGFNQGLASQTYGTAFNQFQTQQNNIFNRLNSIASLGQNAAGNLGNAGTQLGTGIAQAQAGAAASQAGGIQGAANSIGNGLTLSALLSNNNNGYVNGDGTGAGGYGGA